MRTKITEVVCDLCGGLIGHYSYDVDKSIRSDGGVVSVNGDFCDKTCAKKYRDNIRQFSKKDVFYVLSKDSWKLINFADIQSGSTVLKHSQPGVYFRVIKGPFFNDKNERGHLIVELTNSTIPFKWPDTES